MSKSYIALIADAIASRELPAATRARLHRPKGPARGFGVGGLAPGPGAARNLLPGVVRELDPPPAAHRHPAPAGSPGGRRSPARRRSQRDLPPRPPHGLAPRGRRG